MGVFSEGNIRATWKELLPTFYQAYGKKKRNAWKREHITGDQGDDYKIYRANIWFLQKVIAEESKKK